MKKWCHNRVYRALTTEPLLIPKLTSEELEVLRQVEAIRKEFGDAGVERYWEMMTEKEGKPIGA